MTEIAGKWLRVSSGGQDEADQEPDEDAWIASHGYQVGPTYRLHGKSASKGKHQKMLDQVYADMRAGRIQVLVVWYSARIERRGAYDHFVLAHQVREAGGRIEYVKEPWLNEVNAMSDAFLAMQAGANKAYSDTLSMNVRKAHDAIDRNGAVRGRPIYGLAVVGDKKNKTFVIVEDQAGHIRDAADKYLSGWSLQRVCDWLNDSGYLPNPVKSTGVQPRWTPKTLGQLFRRETLIGRHRQGQIVVKVPAILTVAKFKAVNAKLDAKAWRKGVRTGDNPALLTSMLFCTHGHPLYRIQRKWYYDRHGCGIMLPIDKTDAVVLSALDRIWTSSPVKLTRTVTIPGNNHKDEMDQVALDIQALDPLADDYDTRHAALVAEIKRLRTLPDEPDTVQEIEIDVAEMVKEFEAGSDAQKRQTMLDNGFRFEVNERTIFLRMDGSLMFIGTV